MIALHFLIELCYCSLTFFPNWVIFGFTISFNEIDSRLNRLPINNCFNFTIITFHITYIYCQRKLNKIIEIKYMQLFFLLYSAPYLLLQLPRWFTADLYLGIMYSL